MKLNKTKSNAGLTLIEVMVVIIIISVAVIGAMSFRYHSVEDAKKADVHIGAARVGSMLLENWKGMGGLSGYNPTSQFGTLFSSQYAITPTTAASAPSPCLATKLTSCQIKDLKNNVYYYVTLSYAAPTVTTPEALNAAVSWNQKYDTGSTVAHKISMTTYADLF
jgi:prepilin-type N-terminal cleavage/methylation domain-containing protein